MLIIGTIGTLMGTIIYYVLPKTLVNMNLGVLIEVFLMILVGMILGLGLITLNLQKMVELILLNVFLFYEKASMKLLIKKNLIAHTESNRLTAVIYSLTLGSIVFTMITA